MKKILSLLCILLMTFLFSCKGEVNKIKVLLPSGTPLIAIGNLLDDTDFEFTIVNGQDPLLAGFKEKKYDMIISPLNLGAKLYLSSVSNYKFKAVISTNNTYIISKNNFSSINDLEGKKILGYGNGSTPSIALNAALKINSITSEVEYQNSVADVASLFASSQSQYDFYLSAEPSISSLRKKNEY